MKKFVSKLRFFCFALVLLTAQAYGSAIKELTTSKATTKSNKSTVSASTVAPQMSSDLKKHSVGLGLGQTFILGDFENDSENKISWDLLYNYSASHSFDLMAGFHSSKYEYKNRYARMTGLTTSFKAKLYHFDAFAPFAAAGLGFYSPKVKRILDGQPIESESKIVFGSNLGVGADLRLNSNFMVGILGQYHNPFDVKQETGPEVEGSYFKLLITTFYTF